MVKTRSGRGIEFWPAERKSSIEKSSIKKSNEGGPLPKGMCRNSRRRRASGVEGLRVIRESEEWTETLTAALTFLDANPAGPKPVHLLRRSMTFIAILEEQIRRLE